MLVYSLKKICAIAIQQQNIDSTSLPFVLQNYIKREIQDCCTYKIEGSFVYVRRSPKVPLFRDDEAVKYGGGATARCAENAEYQFDCAIKSTHAMEGIMSIPAPLGHIDCMWKMKHHGFQFNYDNRYIIHGQDGCCPYRYYHFDCIKFLIDHNQTNFQYVIAENIQTIPIDELRYIVTKCNFQPDATLYVLKRAVDSGRKDIINFLSNFKPAPMPPPPRLTSIFATVLNLSFDVVLQNER